MKCPICGKEMVKGIVRANDLGSLTNSLTTLTWFSEDEMKKKFVHKGIDLSLKGEGYYSR